MTKSPLLSLPGAVPAEGPDEGVAAHYGDLFREQRTLADGTGFVDLSHRGVVTVSGADRLPWLHLLLTQHVENLPPGQATEALILSAHGHIEHALYLVDDGATTWMHVEPGTQGPLLAYLESMKFFYRVETADATDRFAVEYLPAGSITEVPAEVKDGPIEARIDTTDGAAELDLGHHESADASISLEYDTAKAFLVEGNPQVVMQAVMSGKVRISGDMTKVLALQGGTPGEAELELGQRLRDITD